MNRRTGSRPAILGEDIEDAPARRPARDVAQRLSRALRDPSACDALIDSRTPWKRPEDGLRSTAIGDANHLAALGTIEVPRKALLELARPTSGMWTHYQGRVPTLSPRSPGASRGRLRPDVEARSRTRQRRGARSRTAIATKDRCHCAGRTGELAGGTARQTSKAPRQPLKRAIASRRWTRSRRRRSLPAAAGAARRSWQRHSTRVLVTSSRDLHERLRRQRRSTIHGGFIAGGRRQDQPHAMQPAPRFRARSRPSALAARSTRAGTAVGCAGRPPSRHARRWPA